MPTTEKFPGDDKKTGKYVLLVDGFHRATKRNDLGQIIEWSTHNKGERLHLTDEDAARLLNTDPPAVKEFGADDPEPAPLLAGSVPEGTVNEGSNQAQIEQAKIEDAATAATDVAGVGLSPEDQAAAQEKADAELAKATADAKSALGNLANPKQ